jgi:hypothetical protein
MIYELTEKIKHMERLQNEIYYEAESRTKNLNAD